MAGARNLMKNHGRRRPKAHLTWAISKDIRDNVENMVHVGDPLFTVLQNHAAAMTEMRYVRNHIVHKNGSTLRKFREVVRQYYGGLRPGMTPGVLLLTGALGRQPLIERYLIYYRVLIKELLHA